MIARLAVNVYQIVLILAMAWIAVALWGMG